MCPLVSSSYSLGIPRQSIFKGKMPVTYHLCCFRIFEGEGEGKETRKSWCWQDSYIKQATLLLRTRNCSYKIKNCIWLLSTLVIRTKITMRPRQDFAHSGLRDISFLFGLDLFWNRDLCRAFLLFKDSR